MQLQVLFGLRTKYHLESTRLWLASNGLRNGFGNKLRRNSPITTATMEYLLCMNTVRIVMPKISDWLWLRFWRVQLISTLLLPKIKCGYSGTAEEVIVNYVHPLFLKAKASEISILIGAKLLLDPSPTNNGKQWKLRLRIWSLWLIGRLLSNMMICISLNRHGVSSVSAAHMY